MAKKKRQPKTPGFFSYSLKALGAVAMLFLSGCAALLGIRDNKPKIGHVFNGAAIKVSDGDSLHVMTERGEKYHVRLWGSDAPELRQGGTDHNGNNVATGILSRDFMRAATAGKTVRCEVKGIDKYKRVLAVCSVDGVDLSKTSIRAGMAYDFAKYTKGHYKEDEAYARDNKNGIWALAEHESPSVWRAKHKIGFK